MNLIKFSVNAKSIMLPQKQLALVAGWNGILFEILISKDHKINSHFIPERLLFRTVFFSPQVSPLIFVLWWKHTKLHPTLVLQGLLG